MVKKRKAKIEKIKWVGQTQFDNERIEYVILMVDQAIEMHKEELGKDEDTDMHEYGIERLKTTKEELEHMIIINKAVAKDYIKEILGEIE